MDKQSVIHRGIIGCRDCLNESLEAEGFFIGSTLMSVGCNARVWVLGRLMADDASLISPTGVFYCSVWNGFSEVVVGWISKASSTVGLSGAEIV